METSRSTRSRVLLPLGLAALGPIGVGGILAVRFADSTALVAAPAITFGVLAVTSPALYIATAAVGAAPPLAQMVRALATALAAFGIALAGLMLPAMFLAWSSIDPMTTVVIASGALVIASTLAARRFATELASGRSHSAARSAVFAGWTFATLGLAGKLWWSFATGVAS
jgi:hypothetical protein